MAQTTYSVAMACGYVAISSDCITYTDISGYASIVSVPEQARITGEAYTFEGNVSIVKAAKLQPIAVQVSIIYTEDDAGAFDTLQLLHIADECGGTICLRWAPRGNTAGYQQYTIEGPLTGFQYPGMDAGQGGPIVTTFTVTGPEIVAAVIAS